MSSSYTAAAGTSTLPQEPAEESSMLRSETMSMIQLYIPSELSHPTMAELGELGVIQFNDLQPEATSFSRPFTQEIRRLDESERRVRYLMTLLEKASIKPKEPLVNSPSLLRRTQRDVNEVEETLKDLEEKFVRMGENIEQLQKRFVELTELRHVLQESSSMMVTGSPGADYEGIDLSGSDANAPLIRKDVELGAGVGPGVASSSAQRDVGLNFVAGVINRDKIITFERILWRVLRGNLYMNQTQIDEPILNPLNGESVSKNVFIIFATGSELLAKIKKISEALGATIFPLSQSAEKRSEDLLEVSARLEDLNNVLFNSAQARRMELVRLSQNIEAWRVIIKKEKMIYHTMNLFNHDTTRKCLIAEGWCPTASVQSIQYALHGVCERAGSLVPPMLNVVQTKAQPPTFIRLNKFTRGYQAIIDAYGVAKYKEVNPGLFTVVTFPFLFAVMFGDWGHGFLMLFVALYLVIREKELDRKDSEEMFRMLFQGRYIILLMSIFSIYVGLIYNDIFSLCVFLTPSSWDMDAKPIPKCINDNCAYPFGIDPNWRLSANSMVFLNSYKMKMSILLGVTHMLFGIFLSLVNHRYYKKTINIIGEFIPQILFLSCLFGYLSILIIYKWLRDPSSWRYPAPGLLNTLIFMFLKPGTVDKEMEIYPGQAVVQTLLVLIAVVCIPWMLLLKPYYLYQQHKKNSALGYSTINNESPVIHDHNSDAPTPVINNPTSDHDEVAEHGSEEHFDFSEIMVHQIIHTIEFCLGCVSNTASYLRLWALSLAHSQLSEVLWDMTMKSTIQSGALLVFVGYAAWFSLTIGILLGMEGLSAFLHALRLHWVEFDGKFYEGSGTPFRPFDLSKIDETDEAQNQ